VESAPPRFDPSEIAALFPADYRHTYDIRQVLARLVDDSLFAEVLPGDTIELPPSLEALGVSASGYFEHQRRRRSDQPSRPGGGRLSDEALLAHIRAIHAEVKGEYGWPRVWKELLTRGLRVGKDRVQRLMQLHGIKARSKRKFVVTTDSRHDLPVAANLLARDFAPAAPDQVWSSDITYIATDEGRLYLAVVIDLFSRQVVGGSMKPHMRTELVTDALRMAWFRRHPAPGLIFHADRGSQYCSHELVIDWLTFYNRASYCPTRLCA